MIVYIAGLVAVGVAGFFVGGGWAALGFAISWSVLAAACWQFGWRRAPAQTESDKCVSPEPCTQDEQVFVGLAANAREYGWDMGKRLEIARLTCEHPHMRLDELERLYDEGVRSLLGKHP